MSTIRKLAPEYRRDRAGRNAAAKNCAPLRRDPVPGVMVWRQGWPNRSKYTPAGEAAKRRFHGNQ